MLSLLIVVDQFYECTPKGSLEAGNITSIEKLWKFRESMGSRGCMHLFLLISNISTLFLFYNSHTMNHVRPNHPGQCGPPMVLVPTIWGTKGQHPKNPNWLDVGFPLCIHPTRRGNTNTIGGGGGANWSGWLGLNWTPDMASISLFHGYLLLWMYQGFKISGDNNVSTRNVDLLTSTPHLLLHSLSHSLSFSYHKP